MVFPHFFRFVRVPVVVIVAVAVVVVVVSVDVAVVVYLVVLGGTRRLVVGVVVVVLVGCEGGSPQVQSLKKEVSGKLPQG